MQEQLTLTNVSRVALIRTVLDKKCACRFQARGFSMSPFIRDGDVLTISPLTDPSPGLGKPVAFIFPGTEKIIIHRVVGVRGNAYLIKGDNAFVVDGLIPGENILASVARVERKGIKVTFGLGLERYMIAFLSRTNALFLIARLWKLLPFSVRRLL